jgi:hypothetical protein
MSGDTVTIAVDADFDEPTSRLLSVIAGEAMGSRDTSGNSDQQVEIVAVQVVPVTGLGAAKRAGARNARDQVYQTISLRGIPNVPKVLLEGDVIRFVVPKTGY